MNLNELMDEIVGVIEEWNGDVTEEQVRAAILAFAAEQVAAEREACVAECKDGRYWFEIAAAIRAREQEQQT